MKQVYIFTASFCQPCKRLKEALELNKEWLKDKPIKICDIEEHFELAQEYNVRAAPSVVVIDDDDTFQTYVGISEMNQLKKVLKYE